MVVIVAVYGQSSRPGASACGGTQYDDIGGLPDPFRALAQALDHE
jgi:hypothetical protein